MYFLLVSLLFVVHSSSCDWHICFSGVHDSQMWSADYSLTYELLAELLWFLDGMNYSPPRQTLSYAAWSTSLNCGLFYASTCSSLNKDCCIDADTALNSFGTLFATNMHSTRSSRVHWGIGLWKPCSTTCAGVQSRDVWCNDSSNQYLPDAECSELGLKPMLIQRCNSLILCQGPNTPTPVLVSPVHWGIKLWRACSQTCKGGVQERDVWCNNVNNEYLPDSDCSELGAKPLVVQPCNHGVLCSTPCEDRRQEAIADLLARQSKYQQHEVFQHGTQLNHAWPSPGDLLTFPDLEQPLIAAMNADMHGTTVFLGDSLLQGFLEKDGRRSWQKFVDAGIKPVSFARAFDQVEDLLLRYRMYTGKVAFADGSTRTWMQLIDPKLFVVLIGTNNFEFPVDTLAASIWNFVDEIHQDFPCSSVLLLGLPPNTLNENTTQPRVTVNARVNEILRKQVEAMVREHGDSPCFGSVQSHIVWDEFFTPPNAMTGTIAPVFGSSAPLCEPFWDEPVCNLSSLGANTPCCKLRDGLHPNQVGYEVWMEDGGLLNAVVNAYRSCPI